MKESDVSINPEEKTPYWGVLGEFSTDQEFQLAAGEMELPRPRKNFWVDMIEYHQPEVSKVSCTVHGALGAVSDLTGFRFTLDQRRILWREALRLGAQEGWGWYVSKAVDLVRKYSKDFIGDEFVTFQVEIGSPEFKDCLEKGYSVVTSFRGNKAYNEDQADGMLNKYAFGAYTYGHCIRIAKSKVEDPNHQVVDNYVLSRGPNNRYLVPETNFQKLVAGGVFSRLGYVFAYKEDLGKKEMVVPVWAVKSVQKAIQNGFITEHADLNSFVGGEGLEDLLVKTGMLSKREGNVSLIRWIVSMDRAGLLEKKAK